MIAAARGRFEDVRWVIDGKDRLVDGKPALACALRNVGGVMKLLRHRSKRKVRDGVAPSPARESRALPVHVDRCASLGELL